MDDGESGEYEWEEFEEEQEEEQSEAPELIPIGADIERDQMVRDQKQRSKSAPQIKKKFEKEPSFESSNESEKKDVAELSSSALSEEIAELEGSEESDHQHGFVFSYNLNTYKLNKAERIAKQKEEGQDKDEHRKDYQRKRDKKLRSKIGKTNIEKLKNKPMAMMLPKKVKDIKLKRDKEARKVPIRKTAIQLGKYKKHTAQKLDAKKRRKTNH